jgi:hypothetical protein
MTKLFFNNPPNNPGTKTYTGSTASLADLASENVDLSVGFAGLLCWVSANVLCQVRIYNTSAARAADTRDAVTPIPPEGVSGLLAEVETETGSLAWSGAVPFVNAETPQSKFIFLKVFNISGSAAAVSYTIKANVQHAYNSLPGEVTAEWGGMVGTLSDQTDLQAALDDKVDTALLGTNNGVATLDGSGKVPSAQLPSTSVTDTLVFVVSATGVDAAVTTAVPGILYMPFELTNVTVRMEVETAPTGANLIVDMNWNGVTAMGNKFTIEAGEFSTSTATTAPSLLSTTLPLGTKISFDIDQVGATVKGRFIQVILQGTRSN